MPDDQLRKEAAPVRASGSEPFIGRHDELALLHGNLAEASARRPRLICIEGAAGIGKTALLRRFVSQAGPHVLLWAGGEEAESAVPFGLLGCLLATVPSPSADAARRLRGSLTPHADRLGVVAGMLSLLRSVEGRSRTTIVVVDDAQWADRASTQALRLAFRGLERDRVLMIVATRHDATDAQDGWQRVVARDNRASQIEIGGLSATEVAQLAAARGQVISLASARRLREHTHGHPLHTCELVQQVPPAALAATRGALPAPRSVAGLVGDRLAVCSPSARRLVQAAAVLTGPVQLVRAGALAELGDARPALAEAQAAHLLEEVPGVDQVEVDFPHDLFSAAVYTALGSAERAALHARAATLSTGRQQLRHRVAAVRGSGVPTEALAAELAALAQVEAAEGALVLAARHLDQAAELSTERSMRRRRVLDAAELLLRAGDAAGAQARLHDKEAIGVDPRTDLVAGELALLVGQADIGQQRLETAWRTATATGEAELAVRAAAAQALLSVTDGRPDDALCWVDRAHGAPPEVAAQTSFARCLALSLAGKTATALASLPDEADPAPTDPAVLLTRGVLRTWTDDLVAARADLVAALELGHDPGLRLASHTLVFLAEAEYRCGDWDEAIAHAELAAAVSAEAGRCCDAAVAHTMAVRPLLARGKWDRAHAHVRQATEVADRAKVGLLVACAGRARAALAGARGDFEAELQALREADTACAPGEPAFFPGEPAEVDALVSLGRLDEAESLLARFEERATALSRRSATAGAARARGRLAAARGCIEQAYQHFDTGLLLLEGLGMPFETARVRLCYAQSAHHAANARVAQKKLRRARDAFVALTAVPWVASCEKLAVQLAPRLPHQRQLDGAGLTLSEMRVAELVATGLTNREVAAQLCVSPKTVESHLGHVYAKFGVKRRDLAGWVM